MADEYRDEDGLWHVTRRTEDGKPRSMYLVDPDPAYRYAPPPPPRQTPLEERVAALEAKIAEMAASR